MADDKQYGAALGALAGDTDSDDHEIQLSPELYEAYLKATGANASTLQPSQDDQNDQIATPSGEHGVFSALRGEPSAPQTGSYSNAFLQSLMNSPVPAGYDTQSIPNIPNTPDSTDAAAMGAAIGNNLGLDTERSPSDTDDSSMNTSSSSVLPMGAQSPMNVLDVGTGSIANQDNLKAAQDQAEQRRRQALLFGGLDKITAGLNYAQPTSQKFYEQQLKDANQPVQDYLQQVAMQKQDPDSPMSKGFRDYLKQFGLDVRGDFSAQDAEQLMPTVLKQYEANENRQATAANIQQKTKAQQDEMVFKYKQLQLLQDLKNQGKLDADSAKKATKEAADQTKAVGDVSKQIITFTGRAGRVPFNNELYANNALSLVQGQDLNNLSGQQLSLFYSELNKLAKGGVGTEKELDNIMPHTLTQKVMSIGQNISNAPVGADAGKFVNQLVPYLNDLKQNSSKQLGQEIGTIIDSNRSRLAPDDLQHLIQIHQNRLQAADSPLLKELPTANTSIVPPATRNTQGQVTTPTPTTNQIKVSNGKETYLIDPSHLSDAQKDGFKQIQ